MQQENSLDEHARLSYNSAKDDDREEKAENTPKRPAASGCEPPGAGRFLCARELPRRTE